MSRQTQISRRLAVVSDFVSIFVDSNTKLYLEPGSSGLEACKEKKLCGEMWYTPKLVLARFKLDNPRKLEAPLKMMEVDTVDLRTQTTAQSIEFH